MSGKRLDGAVDAILGNMGDIPLGGGNACMTGNANDLVGVLSQIVYAGAIEMRGGRPGSFGCLVRPDRARPAFLLHTLDGAGGRRSQSCLCEPFGEVRAKSYGRFRKAIGARGRAGRRIQSADVPHERDDDRSIVRGRTIGGPADPTEHVEQRAGGPTGHQSFRSEQAGPQGLLVLGVQRRVDWVQTVCGLTEFVSQRLARLVQNLSGGGGL